MVTRNGDSTDIDALLAQVYHQGGHDFRGYRRGTVTRRLQRRLHATGSRTYREYMALLDTHPQEYRHLAQDLTIKVSKFFRNPVAFQQLTYRVLPELVDRKRGLPRRRLRLWSTACARGQEPYSIGITLAQYLGQGIRDFDIVIYATDVDREALNQAEAGKYPAREVNGLSPAIRGSYFINNHEGYQVVPSIKRLIQFARFNIISGTPLLTNLDCVFCCNLLIYLQPPLQERVLLRLYQSLATAGYLVLGEVETVPRNLRRMFQCIDSEARIYRKL